MIQKSQIIGIRFKKRGRTTFIIFEKRYFLTSSDNNNDDEDNSSMDETSDASSVSSNQNFDSSNGRELDRYAMVAQAYSGDKEGLDGYFNDKASSIRSDLQTDIDDVRGTEFDTPEYISELRNNAESLLAELELSKDTIRDLADIPLSEPSSPSHFPQDSSDIERTDYMSDFGEDDC